MKLEGAFPCAILFSNDVEVELLSKLCLRWQFSSWNVHLKVRWVEFQSGYWTLLTMISIRRIFDSGLYLKHLKWVYILHIMQSHLYQGRTVGLRYSCLHAIIQWHHAGLAGVTSYMAGWSFIHLCHLAALW